MFVCMCALHCRLAAWAWSVAEWGLTLNTARIEHVCVLGNTNTSKPRPTAPVDTNKVILERETSPLRILIQPLVPQFSCIIHSKTHTQTVLFRISCLTDSQPVAHAMWRVRETCETEREAGTVGNNYDNCQGTQLKDQSAVITNPPAWSNINLLYLQSDLPAQSLLPTYALSDLHKLNS